MSEADEDSDKANDEEITSDNETTETEPSDESTTLQAVGDSIDDLFAEPDETVADETDSDKTQTADEDKDEEETVNIAELTRNDKPIVKGSLEVLGATAVGFLDWPVGFDNTYFTQLGSEFDGSAYYSMVPVFTIDVRPNSYFRFYTSLSAELSESSLSFGSPVFGQLFIDYTFNDNYFFRVGKQSLTWGQGQLLGNIGNFVSNVDDGVAVKSFIPLGMNGLTALIYTDVVVTNPLYFSYAALYETTLGAFTMGLSAKYNYKLDQQLISDVYLKTVIGEVDFALEARGDFDLDFGADDYLWPSCYALTNFFWEDADIGIKLLGEYIFSYGPEITVNDGWSDEDTVSTRWAEWGRHQVGLGLIATKPWIGSFKPGIRWYHNFIDTSGQFVLGLTGTFAPMITANIAIPIVYGPNYGFYRLDNEDPENRILSLIIQLKLKSSFKF